MTHVLWREAELVSLELKQMQTQPPKEAAWTLGHPR